MSAIDALASRSQSSGVGPNAFSSLSSESFVKIIFSELGHQDPLQPSDSNALLQQLSNLRNIQSSTDLSNSMSSLVAQNEFAAAAGLIGQVVSGVSDELKRVTGEVTSVTHDAYGAVLKLKTGDRVHMVNMDQIGDGGAA